MTDLQAGRELDALVAERVMGWHELYGGWVNQEDRSVALVNYWRPSTDIITAWQVVEHIRQTVPSFGISCDARSWYAGFGSPAPKYYAIADTAPLAICRAALAAVGV